MMYHLSLRVAGLIAGTLLILLSGLAFVAPVRRWLPQFPRSRAAGATLLAIDFAWSFWLLSTMEMGEFSSFRRPLQIILPIGFFLVLGLVDEFLAVRSLGILCLLAAEPLLDAAFLQPQSSRLLLTVLAYLMIIAGLIWVTMPYLLRDQIGWSEKSATRWGVISASGIIFGLAIFGCAWTLF